MKRIGLKEIIWKRFWRLIPIEELDFKRSKSWAIVRMFKCKCDCWNECERTLWEIRHWSNQSCWCRCHEWSVKLWKDKTIHWLTNSQFRKKRQSIKRRCNYTKLKCYKDYGWRWITYDERREKFEWFYKDMHESYCHHIEQFWEKETTIDRINNDWNYCKDNCRWTTNKEQSNNRRSSRMLHYNWEIKTVAKWADELSLGRNAIVFRYDNWLDLDTKDLRKKYIKRKWQEKTITEWSKETWIKHWTISKRLKLWWCLEHVFSNKKFKTCLQSH